ncbi:Translin-1 [Clarireedia jacksonii]
MADITGMVDPKIFEDLQTKIDEDAEVRDQIKAILQTLERQCRNAQSILSRAHSTPAAHLQPVLESAEKAIKEEVDSIGKLSSVASSSPYYKYNGIWTRDVQNVIFAVLLCGWLGGMAKDGRPAEAGRLFTIEEVGEILQVPVNLKDRDAFHISIEEYLLSLITLIEELSRLAINSVTLGDYQRPLQISQFVKDLHAGFQILNLKNDVLRRRSDSIKYNVKKIEDIVYDLSLRNLVTRPGAAAATS